MKYARIIPVLCLLAVVLALSSCSPTTSEKDVIGKWQSTKLDNLWMEFFPDMTSTGGKWSITQNGQIKITNADGTEHLATLKDGKLIFPEFGERGVFVKESGKK